MALFVGINNVETLNKMNNIFLIHYSSLNISSIACFDDKNCNWSILYEIGKNVANASKVPLRFQLARFVENLGRNIIYQERRTPINKNCAQAMVSRMFAGYFRQVINDYFDQASKCTS